MNTELLEALEQIEKEKDISKETLLEAIENSLLTACKNHFGKADNVKVNIDPVTCQFSVYAEKTVVENVEDDVTEISLEKAREIDSKYELGDIVNVEIKSKEFGRIATQNAKNVILQKIREEERKVLFNQYYAKEKDVVTGVVQRYLGRNVSINLGKVDAILNENEMVKGEVFKPTERIKVYILEVKALDQNNTELHRYRMVYSGESSAENDDLKVSDDNFMRFTTHGRVYLPEETARLRTDINAVLRKNTVDQEWHPVFETPFFLTALFLLLMTEWFLRRRYNLF